MSKTNCINCGAAKDTNEIKCPFCGTTYLDLTAIDFASGDPVVCEFILPFSCETVNSPCKLKRHGKMVMSMLAVPQLEEISQTANHVDVFGGCERIYSFIDSWDVNVGVSFKPVERKNSKTLFELRVE